MDEKKKRTVTGKISEGRPTRSALEKRLTPRRITSALGVAAAAFLLGGCGLPFSVYPLGVAFLCAATHNAIFAAIGIMASAFVGTLPWYVPFFAALGVLAIRLLGRMLLDAPVDQEGVPLPLFQRLREGAFCEGLYLRIACSCVAAFSMSLAAVIGGGFQYYDLFGTLFSMVVAPISTLLFAGLFEGEAERYASERNVETVRNISYVALALALCLSLTRTQFQGLSAAFVFSFAATLWIARRRGLLTSLAVGVLCGVTMDLSYSFVLAIAAFAAFCVQERSASFASAVGCVAGTVSGVVVTGVDDLGGLFLPMAIGSAVYTLAEKGAERLCPVSGKTVDEQTPMADVDPFSSNERVADAMTELSTTLLALHDKNEDADALGDVGAEVFAEAYAAMATLLREAAQSGREELVADYGCRAALLARLNDMGYSAVTVSVTGTRRKHVCLSSTGEIDSDQIDRISEVIARACGVPVLLTLQDGGRLTATRRPVFDAVYGSGFLAGEDICGDVVAVFRDDERGYLYALLNDGMGKGRDAAVTARLASLFLRKLLPAGVKTETAVDMLHRFLRLGYNRGERESSTTVDLLALDRFDGRISFVKSGAAPTYVKRGSHVLRLESTTVPVGILPETDAAEIYFQAKEGDVIVMVSDGIHDGDGECPWIVEYLEKSRDQDPTEMAKRLVALAAERGGKDDLSVIVLFIRGCS